ncbi:MAG: hypothetical protein WC490_00605 [Candidatus Margulisiibacteriota bacterium]
MPNGPIEAGPLRVLTNTGGRQVRFYQREYGFRLCPRYAGDNSKYEIPVAGSHLVINDFQYAVIESGAGRMYLGTHHNAAYYFTLLSLKDGLISGRELFLHTDRPDHPDNNFQILGELPALDAPLKLQEHMLTTAGGRDSTVTISNYVAALKHHLCPEMTFAFLHSGIRETHDWGKGSDFLFSSSVFDVCPGSLPSKNGCIASTDLDIFDSYVGDTDKEIMLKRLVEIGQRCRLVMAFTSPAFVFPDWAGDFAGRYAEGVFGL